MTLRINRQTPHFHTRQDLTHRFDAEPTRESRDHTRAKSRRIMRNTGARVGRFRRPYRRLVVGFARQRCEELRPNRHAFDFREHPIQPRRLLFVPTRQRKISRGAFVQLFREASSCPCMVNEIVAFGHVTMVSAQSFGNLLGSRAFQLTKAHA